MQPQSFCVLIEFSQSSLQHFCTLSPSGFCLSLTIRDLSSETTLDEASFSNFTPFFVFKPSPVSLPPCVRLLLNTKDEKLLPPPDTQNATSACCHVSKSLITVNWQKCRLGNVSLRLIHFHATSSLANRGRGTENRNEASSHPCWLTAVPHAGTRRRRREAGIDVRILSAWSPSVSCGIQSIPGNDCGESSRGQCLLFYARYRPTSSQSRDLWQRFKVGHFMHIVSSCLRSENNNKINNLQCQKMFYANKGRPDGINFPPWSQSRSSQSLCCLASVVVASQLCSAEPEAPSLQSKQREMLDMMWTVGLEPGARSSCARVHARTHAPTAIL